MGYFQEWDKNGNLVPLRARLGRYAAYAVVATLLAYFVAVNLNTYSPARKLTGIYRGAHAVEATGGAKWSWIFEIEDGRRILIPRRATIAFELGEVVELEEMRGSIIPNPFFRLAKTPDQDS
ncbi:hypothetical protein [Pseudokordiimonas caeni]|uniref:hypothetical protein n=1 Tax=Pseudokordiimonas caeni TaxID=2997908 RepID=UPI0028114C2F|nr:hypothetical protein [Pseudokordiimonas caeni]